MIRPYDDHASASDRCRAASTWRRWRGYPAKTRAISKAITSLPGQKQRRHGPDVELTMSLLEHRADTNHRIDILAAARILSNRDFVTLCGKSHN